ncbi:MAG: aminoacyl-tRNA hydrolase [Actinobacteria bacterium]|nr:aminoacyl-tRNA hydrolase [Actinomycetota bacterium]
MLGRRKQTTYDGGDRPSAVVVGLGNPGTEYSRTRHNAGSDAVDILAGRLGVDFKKDRSSGCRLAKANKSDQLVLLAIPLTYMNESGVSVRSALKMFPLDEMSSLIVVHDEMDIDPGRVKIRVGGGAAGHNGIRSIMDHLHSGDFIRVRIGIGSPPSKEAGAKYVLSRPVGADRELLDSGISQAVEAVESIISQGVDVAMRSYN